MSHLFVLAFIAVLTFGAQPMSYAFRKITSR